MTDGFFLADCFKISCTFALLLKLSKMNEFNQQFFHKKNQTVIVFEVLSLVLAIINLGIAFIPCVGILVFNIVPLVYMISMAFTSYSKEDEHLQLFDWNGLTQFKRVLNFSGNMGRQFWHVLAWTVVWALVATFLNYITGMILAMIINRKETKAKGFWRFCFVLSIAVPQFISLMISRLSFLHKKHLLQPTLDYCSLFTFRFSLSCRYSATLAHVHHFSLFT